MPSTKRLVAEAGFKQGDQKFQLKTATLYAQDAEVVQKALQAIGIDSNVVPEGDTFNAVLQKGDFEIAMRLNISEHTIKFHIRSILGKLGASSRTEAVSRGLRSGLIEL